jgi:hypothetical protein
MVYRSKDGHEYASAGRSVRCGNKVRKEYVYLGKVLDKEKGIYENRKLGVVGFDLEKGVFTSPVLSDIPRREPDEKLILDFGDAYFLDTLIRSLGMMDCMDAIECSVPDSLRSLVLYYIVSREASCNAETWYEGNYARILYPDADLNGRRISEIFKDIGNESKWRSFFSSYTPLATRGADEVKVIIDSSGLPNSSHMDITAVSNHNGKISDEVRLILVVNKDTNLPLYMRYVPGNVNDVSTLIRTMTELKTRGVKCAYALLDSGYCSEKNIAELYKGEIDFMTRLAENRTLYKDLKKNVLPEIECRENFTTYNDRQLFVKKTECELAPGCKGYAYAILDEDRKYLENGRKAGRARAEGLSDAELYDSMTGHGFFVLISNMDIPNSQVLPDYYVRQTMEQFIDVGKNYTNLLPLRVHSEETFRGHLLISFIASATVQMLMNEMKERGKVKGNEQDKGKIKNNSPTVVSALMSLRNQKCKVYDDHILPAEPQAIANKTYELFSIDVPYAIPCRKD